MDITSLPLNLLGLEHSVREPFFLLFSSCPLFFRTWYGKINGSAWFLLADLYNVKPTFIPRVLRSQSFLFSLFHFSYLVQCSDKISCHWVNFFLVCEKSNLVFSWIYNYPQNRLHAIDTLWVEPDSNFVTYPTWK